MDRRLRDPAGEEVVLQRDETGASFRETQRLAPGSYVLEFRPPGGAARTRTIEVRDGEDTVVDPAE